MADSWQLVPHRAAIPGELLAGMVVALGIIPEAIAFSIVAGVDPQVGLFGSICILIVVSLLGGRPGMVSACTAGVALLMGGLMQSHGLSYLLAARSWPACSRSSGAICGWPSRCASCRGP